MFIMTMTLLVIEGLTILSVFGAIFLFDFGVLFLIQTRKVIYNRITAEESFALGEFGIYEGESWLSNWEQVFISNVFLRLLPCGKPKILQALDNEANIRVGGLLSWSKRE